MKTLTVKDIERAITKAGLKLSVLKAERPIEEFFFKIKDEAYKESMHTGMQYQKYAVEAGTYRYNTLRTFKSWLEVMKHNYPNTIFRVYSVGIDNNEYVIRLLYATNYFGYDCGITEELSFEDACKLVDSSECSYHMREDVKVYYKITDLNKPGVCYQ